MDVSALARNPLLSVPACPRVPITGRLKLTRAVTPTVQKNLMKE